MVKGLVEAVVTTAVVLLVEVTDVVLKGMKTVVAILVSAGTGDVVVLAVVDVVVVVDIAE